MNRYSQKLFLGTALVTFIILSSCKSNQLVAVEGSKIEMTSAWDREGSKAAAALISYKTTVDSLMMPVIGRSSMNMLPKRPESLLSNLVADVLRNAAIPYLGRPADIAIINIGGLRNSLAAGCITYGAIYEILPFENILCIITMKGRYVKELMRNIASVGGEGVSNIYLEIGKDREILSMKIGGEPINDERLYEVATMDYLADGNDKMTAFQKAEKRTCYENETIRNIFVRYIRAESAKGREIKSEIEGRITIK